MKNKLFILSFLLTFLFTQAVFGWEGRIEPSAGVGFTGNPPTRFDMDLEGEYYHSNEIGLGLDFDIWVRGATTFGIVPFTRYHFDVVRNPRFSPYVGVGAGIQFNTNSNAWFDLMLPDLGFQYEVTPKLFFGPDVSFHLLMGSNTTWDMQIVGRIAYRF